MIECIKGSHQPDDDDLFIYSTNAHRSPCPVPPALGWMRGSTESRADNIPASCSQVKRWGQGKRDMKSFYLCTSVLRQVFQLECFMVIINTECRNKERRKKKRRRRGGA